MLPHWRHLGPLAATLPLLATLRGCSHDDGQCKKGDETCTELHQLQHSLGSCSSLHPNSKFVGTPEIRSSSGSCSAVEFWYTGEPKSFSMVYIYGRIAQDAEFTAEWGRGLHPLHIPGDASALGDVVSQLPKGLRLYRYRTLMRRLPPKKAFEVKLADQEDAAFEGASFSCPAEPQVTAAQLLTPAAPFDVKLHRTDPRVNVRNDQGSVCIDLHWSHPQTKLKLLPEDAYFRVSTQYHGEPKKMFCEDEIGIWTRSCGAQMHTTAADSRVSFVTICDLYPKRQITFTVEAYTCDGLSASDHLTAVLPPQAPSFTASLVTRPEAQENAAGFWPKVIIDWIPQHDPWIRGHAIYLALKDLGAMKLLCWIPRQKQRRRHAGTGEGQIALPIQKKNHTHSRDSALLHDYLQRYHVHQEQQIQVATRSVANISRPGSTGSTGSAPVKDEFLESPVSSYSLGDWLILEDQVKCLTAFAAKHGSYVAKPVQLSFTEEQAMMLYD